MIPTFFLLLLRSPLSSFSLSCSFPYSSSSPSFSHHPPLAFLHFLCLLVLLSLSAPLHLSPSFTHHPSLLLSPSSSSYSTTILLLYFPLFNSSHPSPSSLSFSLSYSSFSFPFSRPLILNLFHIAHFSFSTCLCVHSSFSFSSPYSSFCSF